jgi:hypothetical protein
MIYLIDPQDTLSGKPCKKLCTLVCGTLCSARGGPGAIKPLYGVDP